MENNFTIDSSKKACRMLLNTCTPSAENKVFVMTLSSDNTVESISGFDDYGINAKRVLDCVKENTKGLIIFRYNPKSVASVAIADLSETQYIHDTVSQKGIELLDFIILLAKKYYSFADGCYTKLPKPLGY